MDKRTVSLTQSVQTYSYNLFAEMKELQACEELKRSVHQRV